MKSEGEWDAPTKRWSMDLGALRKVWNDKHKEPFLMKSDLDEVS